MTSLERVLAIIKGEKPDYIPVFPMLNEYASKLMGISELEYYKHPELLAEGQMKLVKTFDYDFLLPFTFLAREIAALGGSVYYHEEGSPTIGGLLVKTCQDILNLPIPDFENNSETKIVLDQIRKLVTLAEGKYPIVGVATGPFSWPTLVMGNDQWLTALFMEEPEMITAVIKKAEEFVVAWANAQIKAGAHVVAVVEGSATKSVIPEDIFLSYVQPSLSRITKRITAPVLVLGVGGEFEPYLTHLRQTGIGGVVISTDDNLKNSLEKAGNLIIIGNVNNLEFMDYTDADIENIVKNAMEVGKGKRFIFSSQYVLPPFVTEDKIKKFVAFARQYGKSE
jgi:MtaA/CmuA family methyltransferase